MKDPFLLELTGRILAMQDVVARLCLMVYGIPPLTDEQVAKMHDVWVSRAKRDVVAETRDPAMSDLLSGEYEEHLTALLRGIERLRGMAPRQWP